MLRTLGIGLWMLLVWQLAAGLWSAPLNPDAGYYLPLARRVAAGEVPFRDFPSLYPPGAYYLFALLGQGGLASPLAIKGALVAVHLLNLILLALVLRRWGFERAETLCLAALGGLWTMRAEGVSVALEPLQNLYLLLALWACLGRDLRSAAAAGLAVGCALLVKQYALLAIPGLLLVCLSASGKEEFAAVPAWRRWMRPLTLLAMTGAPFLLFALLTGQAPVPLFRQLASYGGEAASYGVAGWKSLYLNLVETNGPALPLLASGILSLWLLWRQPSMLNLGLMALLAGSSAPLLVRSFPHYVQMAIPWSILVWARWSRAATAPREGATADVADSGEARRPSLLIASGLLLLPVLIQGAVGSIADLRRRDDLTQLAWARELPKLVAQVRGLAADDPAALRDVTVMNGEWLYALTDCVPPQGDYHFYDATHVARRVADPPPLVVVTPGRYPLATLDGWLRQLGLAPAYSEDQFRRAGDDSKRAISEPLLRIYTRRAALDSAPSRPLPATPVESTSDAAR